ncbi:MAG TPA: carbohydrate porin [Micropepsaceae bacterium]|jgi:high affinity Mn2+ porin|nr:carbohydrate porin [Micropepsaceae bacterium]
MHSVTGLSVLAVLTVAAPLSALAEAAQDTNAPEDYSLHGQSTFVLQYHPGFHSPYRGANSLDPGSRGNETFDAAIFASARLWRQTEAYLDVEADQGFGLSNTLGAAGYLSGEAYKVGANWPYLRVPRLFLRQTFDLGDLGDLGGEDVVLAPAANQLGGTRATDNIIVTLGKFSPTDMFDANRYAHDPRADFFNWSIVDSGAFDYAADAWGYSYGGAAEWTQAWWTLRLGAFNLSRVPNSRFLQRDFSQFELVAEGEMRETIDNHPGSIKLLGFVNRGHMADYERAVTAGLLTNTTPDTATLRDYASRPGFALNVEQQIDSEWGVFVRASFNDGTKEAYEFTEINKSLAAGASFAGTDWGRPEDVFGIAGVVNGLSRSARDYFAAGGLGILIGDGRLPHYSSEDILETYYRLSVVEGVAVSFDYQYVAHPAYNADRGPVSAFGLRVHAER